MENEKVEESKEENNNENLEARPSVQDYFSKEEIINKLINLEDRMKTYINNLIVEESKEEKQEENLKKERNFFN